MALTEAVVKNGLPGRFRGEVLWIAREQLGSYGVFPRVSQFELEGTCDPTVSCRCSSREQVWHDVGSCADARAGIQDRCSGVEPR